MPSYIAAPWLNTFYGFATLGRLHERRGSAEGGTNGFNQDSWGRISGQHNTFEAGRFSYDSDIWFAQLGHDLFQGENAAGTQATAGVMITLGKQETDAQDKARAVRPGLSIDTGKIKTDAYGLGGYYTLMTQQGGYVDLVGQERYTATATKASMMPSRMVMVWRCLPKSVKHTLSLAVGKWNLRGS